MGMCERPDQLRAIRATAEKEIVRLDVEMGIEGCHPLSPIPHTDAANERRDWATLAYLADAQLRRLEDGDATLLPG